MDSSTIELFKQKLKAIDAAACGIVGYQASYLDHLLAHPDHYFRIYSDCIRKAEEKKDIIRHDAVLLDYGCGNGLLGLFAKFLGYGTIISCDVDASSIDAAKKLSITSGIVIDHFVEGDIDDVKKYCDEKRLSPTVIIGTDVIEHIYDLEVFFKTLKQINPQQVNVFTTASNPSNPYKVKQLRKLHIRDELQGGYSTHITQFEDTSKSEEAFIVSRQKIIEDMKLNLTNDELSRLAKLTRGKNKADIESGVRLYKESGTLPQIDESDSNTCEPFSGSWSERILELEKYRIIYNEASFDLEITNGFYNDHDAPLSKKWLVKMFNWYSHRFASAGRFLAPFIFLKGTPKNQ